MLRRVRAELRQAVNQMARRPVKILCCGAVLLTCALLLPITLTCGRVKSVVSPARPPMRFFPAEAPVLDLFLGQLEEADRLREEADVSVLFFYAPWCAHSITARQHVQQVALRLADQVQFLAVNCWWHQGRCRKQKSFFQYPVIHLYYRRFGPIEYRGPVRSDYLESFILRVCAPLVYLPTAGALHSFLTQHQGVVGYFRFSWSPQPAGYLTFLLSALHALRRDHQGAVRFAVVTNQAVAEGVSLREDESVYLHRRLNSSLVFPRAQRNFTAQAVSDWVLENKESVVYWIQPTRAKSYSLEAELQKGPALLTFLPHNPLTANQLLDQVSAVALLYQSGCGSSAPRLCCQCVPVCASSGVCEVCVQRSVCSGLHQSLQRLQSSASCWSVQSSYTPSGRLSVCCGASVCRGGASVCSGASISGLQCRSNRTLRFYMLDAELHRPLAHRLGARGGLHRPFITIINLRDETHHVLEPSGTLEGFIQNFSVPYSPLRRHLVGQEAPQQTQSLVQEVTSDSFLQTVMDSQRDVLLLYYSAWCGFCSVLNHVFLQLGRLFRGNRALTVARVNVGRNDLPWEFMVDHLPTVLFFPRHRKQMSVKFPENTPMTVPNLLRFVLQHTGHAPWEEQQSGEGEEPVRGEESVSLLGAELRALQQEVFSLHRVRERVSQQLDVLWRENRRLTLHTHTLQSQNQELQAQIHQLEALYREKTHQLTHTVHRLQELADASEELLKENTLLKVLLTALSDADHRQTTEDRQTTDHRQATEEHDENTHAEDESS
ncbi:thioredoxin domain-containing protein 11 isoform X2 [Danio rerio]|uniref:Thioredoxin domain-containing protein 11 isoform X2 n=1 Tax=Danio rerio TaxID=7955 RepID=A0A8M3B5H2_DANRE|nr:thioredoxin domain-containing protein 11 isoform X1 [Danio rerio]|eukprot:XP_009294513.1 thioredoxin domain-containing protein 11 isoform X1 [Danio rerio]